LLRFIPKLCCLVFFCHFSGSPCELFPRIQVSQWPLKLFCFCLLPFCFWGFLTLIISWIYRFSLSSWAYTFPLTGAAISTIRYSDEVTNVVTQVLAVILSAVSTLTVSGLLVSSIVHAFVLRDLFPNDLVIAISNSKPRQHHHRKWFHIRRGSSDEKEIEHYLKFSDSDVKDIESSLDPTTSSSLSNAHHNEAYASTSLAGPSHFVDLQPSHARKS